MSPTEEIRTTPPHSGVLIHSYYYQKQIVLNFSPTPLDGRNFLHRQNVDLSWNDPFTHILAFHELQYVLYADSKDQNFIDLWI